MSATWTQIQIRMRAIRKIDDYNILPYKNVQRKLDRKNKIEPCPAPATSVQARRQAAVSLRVVTETKNCL